MKQNNINIDEVICKAAKVAIKEYDKEKMKKQEDIRLHNTRLLMRNYNCLREHIDNVTDEFDFEFDNECDEVWLRSVTRTKLRTMKMMAYIESALKILEKRFIKKCEEYKYKAFKLYYIDEKTNEEIQEILGCGKNSPKKWNNLVTEELSILLWGIEAIGM